MLELRHESVQLHNREYLRQAEQYRLSRLASVHQSGPTRRFLAWTGRRLVMIGEGLQGRATAPAPTVLYSEPCC